MRRYFAFLVVLSLILVTGCTPLNLSRGTAPTETIGLIPLDSRPANTQYPELISQIAGFDLDIPYDYLDNFLVPADKDSIWNWLEKTGNNHPTIIINTSVLFNGSLIETRHPQSYVNSADNLARFEQYCRENKGQEIIVINVLPRLLPSQFTNLWQHKDPLVEYAISLDKADLKGGATINPPNDVAQDIVESYLSIYENAQLITEGLIRLAEQGLISHLLIGQDDAEEFGLSNRIVRKIDQSIDGETITFVHGADELTMLALVRAKIPVPTEGLDIVYSDPSFTNKVFPFEADTLEMVLEAKLSYLGIESDDQSPFLHLIHTNPDNSQLVKDYVTISDHRYIGVSDIAYTNRGDVNLMDWLVLERATGYSGWNTASNAIGTELAHWASVQHFLGNGLGDRERVSGLEAYLKFKYIRLAEDLIYQGILRSKLNEGLSAKGLNPNNLGDKKEEAQVILEELYKPYREDLNQLFLGEHTLGELRFRVERVDSKISLPWARTFEAEITPEVRIRLLGE